MFNFCMCMSLALCDIGFNEIKRDVDENVSVFRVIL